MKVHVDPDDIQERPADERGRIYLGSDFADKTVEIAVLEVKDEE